MINMETVLGGAVVPGQALALLRARPPQSGREQPPREDPPADRVGSTTTAQEAT